MEDIKSDRDNFHFIYRVAALIFNAEKTKILLYYGGDADWRMLPGGKVKGLEKSKDAIARELKEEINFKNLDFELVGVSEEIIKGKDGFNRHTLSLIYKCIFNQPLDKEKFEGNDSEYNKYEWVNISNLKNLKTYPSNILKMIENENIINHIVEDTSE